MITIFALVCKNTLFRKPCVRFAFQNLDFCRVSTVWLETLVKELGFRQCFWESRKPRNLVISHPDYCRKSIDQQLLELYLEESQRQPMSKVCVTWLNNH